jgi:hypothetical protein
MPRRRADTQTTAAPTTSGGTTGMIRVEIAEYGRHRRVAGPRREELAQLAGMSVAY